MCVHVNCMCVFVCMTVCDCVHVHVCVHVCDSVHVHMYFVSLYAHVCDCV